DRCICSEFVSGSDGTRTRDLRRDRCAQSVSAGCVWLPNRLDHAVFGRFAEPRLSPGCTRSFPSRFQEAAAARARPPPVARLAGAADDPELVVRWEGVAVDDGAVELNGDDRVAEDLPGWRVEGCAVVLCSAEGCGAGGGHVDV